MREDGLPISEYINQIAGLLFLKTCEVSPRFNESLVEPEDARWNALLDAADEGGSISDVFDGEECEDLNEYYERAIEGLKDDGPLARTVFNDFSNGFRRSDTLRRTIQDIEAMAVWDDVERGQGIDVLGDAYEFLLGMYAKKAEGAGQYFTPRPLIKTIVEATDPQYDETIHDPAAGTVGFLTETYRYILDETNQGRDIPGDMRRQGVPAANVSGQELVVDTYRLGLMNFIIHGMPPDEADDERAGVTYRVGNSLRENVDEAYDVIIANPPFGGAQNEVPSGHEDVFTVETGTIELNFIQLIMGKLNDSGRAGIIVPEGVLFQSGAAQEIRKDLLANFNLHTILVLPENTFHPYAGVDANVLFFERDGISTEEVWYYDLRSDEENIKESNPLTDDHFKDFLAHYDFDEREDCERFFRVDIEDIEANDYTLNYKAYKDFSSDCVRRDPSLVLSDLQQTADELQAEIGELEALVGGSDD
jgi:type I restriction enzyme M protein